MPKHAASRFWAVCVAVPLVALAAAPSSAATQRPIQQFVAAQTSEFYWYDPATGNAIFLDYAGLWNSAYQLNLGTTSSGTITERPLKSGRAQVHVVLHTRKAFANGGFNLFATLVFGHTLGQVLAGADAAIGACTMTLDFINTAPGAAMPSLIQLSANPQPGQVLQKLQFVASADGTLRDAFGVPDGTPGHAHTTQRGLFKVPGKGIPPDRYPTEKVNFTVSGQ